MSIDSPSKFSSTNTPADIADLPEKAVKLAAIDIQQQIRNYLVTVL